jgi:sugar phosphate isomerase/epimerase
MRWGYNTNGFAHHRLEDAVAILADLGYTSVAITLDHRTLNPYEHDLPEQLARVRGLLARTGMGCVVETGARFLLDPWHKHQPTLVTSDARARERRVDFLRRAIDIAHALQADAVSFWSGTDIENKPRETALDLLVAECRRLCAHAERRGVRLAFEPEPGMLIDSMDRMSELMDRVAHPNLGVTIDVGHLHCQGEQPIAKHLVDWRQRLWNVHIEDARHGVHEHLIFGDGEIDFAPVLRALRDMSYTSGVHVELSRHSHDAVNSARRALDFLTRAAESA